MKKIFNATMLFIPFIGGVVGTIYYHFPFWLGYLLGGMSTLSLFVLVGNLKGEKGV